MMYNYLVADSLWETSHMEKTYSETFVVRATDCDVERRMRLSALFVAMQEGGERHAISLGLGYDAMMARGLFFVLARIHVKTFRAPRCGERVVHTTWLGMTNRFFCPRYHVFTLEDGTLLAAAGALWVTLDTVARKVVSPKAANLPFPDTSDLEPPVELPMRMPHPGEPTQTLTRAPMYSDYDINGHVNNTRYIAWLCDALGSDALAGHYIGDLTAGYEKEIRENDPLTLSLSQTGDDFTFAVISQDGAKRFIAGGSLRKED